MFLGLETGLVAHLLRAIDPIAEVEVGEAQPAGEIDVLQDHIGSKAASGEVGIKKAVDHGDAV